MTEAEVAAMETEEEGQVGVADGAASVAASGAAADGDGGPKKKKKSKKKRGAQASRPTHDERAGKGAKAARTA